MPHPRKIKRQKKQQLKNPVEDEKTKNTTEEMKDRKATNAKQLPQEELEAKANDSNCKYHTLDNTKLQQVVTNSNNNNNKRKRKDVFPYGNYRNYYGYRIDQGAEEDPRLKVFKREWFEGKDCLDIGCNSGVITIQIAKKFYCQSMVGLDIDPDRISDARWHLRKAVREQCVGRHSTKAARLYEKENGPEHTAATLSVESEENARDAPPAEGRDLLERVSFRQENFIECQRPNEKHYDTILCLSVTKWVHLNWGDDGLIALFSKMWRLLHPGGILVLEPQPWKSYEKNRLVSETTVKNYQTIVFYPNSFQEMLLDKIGFRAVEEITSGLSGAKTGFDRPIFVFHK